MPFTFLSCIPFHMSNKEYKITATTEASDMVFSTTRFQYDIDSKDNEDGTETHTFDSQADKETFAHALQEQQNN